MAKRVTIKEGDIFKIIDDKHHRYFQFFYKDLDILASDLVWVFNCEDDTLDINTIMESGYKFYMFTYIRIGIKLNCFEKIGSFNIPNNMLFSPKFIWKETKLNNEVENWYLIEREKRTLLGASLPKEYQTIPYYHPDFPKMAIETMIRGYDDYIKQ